MTAVAREDAYGRTRHSGGPGSVRPETVETVWTAGRYTLPWSRMAALWTAHGVRVEPYGVDLTLAQVVEYAALRAHGLSHAEVAERFGVGRARLHRALRRHWEAVAGPRPP